jgi:hypothetical protein
LIRLERRSQCSVVIDMCRHGIENRWEGDERDESRIESLLLSRIGQRLPCQAAVLLQPVVGIDDLLRISGSGTYLGEQRVGIECDRCEQLIQLLTGGNGLRIARDAE